MRVINRVRVSLFGIMEKCIGESGLKERSMDLELGKEQKDPSNLILGNGIMENHMDLEY